MPYNFSDKNLTPYGGLLPVATMLEKLGFRPLVEQTLTVNRLTRVMDLDQFVLAIVLGPPKLVRIGTSSWTVTRSSTRKSSPF